MATVLPFEDDILKLIFHALPITGIAQNHATTPYANYYVSLLIADPGTLPVPDQLSSEVQYTGYARVSVARTTGGWSVGSGTVSPLQTIVFGACTAIPAPLNATHFGLGTLASGAGKLMAAGKLAPPIAISVGTVPRIDNQPVASRIPSDWV